MRFAVALLFFRVVGVAQQPALPEAALRGSVSAIDGYAVVGARVLIVGPDGNRQAKLMTDFGGNFQSEAIPVGTYSVHVLAPGFGRSRVSNVAVRANQVTSLGAIQLKVLPCDAPFINCDYVSAPPADLAGVIEGGSRIVKAGCGIDFDHQAQLICPPKPTDEFDLELRGSPTRWELFASHGASATDPDAKDPTPKFELDRIGDLSAGADFYLRTRSGARVVHVFFNDEVWRDDREIVLWYSTRQP